MSFIKGNEYVWRGEPERRLVYLGHNWSGNGRWHQFAEVATPNTVWCEVLTRDLHMLTDAPSMEKL